MRMNDNLDLFFAWTASCIKSTAPVQTYKSVTSISDEFGHRVCIFLFLVQRLKLIMGDTREQILVSQLNVVN